MIPVTVMPILAESDNIRKLPPPKYYFFRSAPAEIDSRQMGGALFSKKEDQ
jgi:hypothetical protein